MFVKSEDIFVVDVAGIVIGRTTRAPPVLCAHVSGRFVHEFYRA